MSPPQRVAAFALGLLVSSLATRALGMSFRVGLAGFALFGAGILWGTMGCFMAIWAGPDPDPRASRVGFLVGSALSFLVLGWLSAAIQAPVLTDITTDTEDPPAFTALAKARAGAEVPLEYPGPQAAKLQRKGYPTLQPLLFEAPFEEIFPLAVETAKKLGFELADPHPQPPRFEASETTRWFGFVDDVSIRVREIEPGLTKVDMRSTSRVGKSDLGTNARRIQRYLDALAQRRAPAGQS